jgi:AcrR family transcriptional regulator
MIYYYFGSKEKLYIAVLEGAYASIRATEATLDLDHLPPEEALRTLVAFTFDYENSHPDFIHLVMNENMHMGRHLARSRTIRKLNLSVIDTIRRIYERGCAEGRFRPGLDPVDLHMSISALCFFNVANRHTFSLIFGRDMSSPKALAGRRADIAEMVLRHIRR